jgi:DNA-binding NarL/FixJ family response regulator
VWALDAPDPATSGRPPGPSNQPTAEDELTAREIAAVNLIADGLNNEELAERLALSPSSVRLCLTTLYSKLRARNRADAVSIAHRMRLISLD